MNYQFYNCSFYIRLMYTVADLAFPKGGGCKSLNFGQKLLLPPANEVWGKVMFSQVFVCSTGGGGWFPSMYHRSHDQGGGVCMADNVYQYKANYFLCLGITAFHEKLKTLHIDNFSNLVEFN